jgi:hypothetical protein
MCGTRYHIPERMSFGIKRYIEHGELPGDFLVAVLENNLSEAFGRADQENYRNMAAYVSYFYNEAPSPCWGSKEKVAAWVEGFIKKKV